MSLHTSVGESERLLSPLDPDPVTIINQESSFPVLLVCEHAGKTVPAALNGLGLPDDAREAHIGWDIGAAEVTDSQESSHKVQIVIAEYRFDASARARPTQNGKGVGPAIDQIAQQQDSITASNKVDRAQEPLQGLKATLDVAYGPGAQGGRSA